MSLNYRNADPSLPFNGAVNAGAQVEGQVMQEANATGGQFIQRMRPLPDTSVMLGRPLTVSDLMVGMLRHHNAQKDLHALMQRGR
jgi:hypothetical protein